MLAAQAAATRHLDGLQVTLRPNMEIGVAVVKPVLGFDTRLAIDLRIRGPVDLASDPRLYLLVARPSFTWSAISRVAIAAGLAPSGVEIGRDGVAVDLRVLAARAGVGDLLALVRTLAFDGEAGVLRVTMVAEVPDGGVEAGREQRPHTEAPARSSADRTALADEATLVKELRGARVSGRITISQDLANDALELALAAARARGAPVTPAPVSAEPRGAPAGPDVTTLARWVQRASVRFENGRIVLEPDVVIG
jgi:hypothetical protein